MNGVTLAEGDHTEVVEGNHYFPPGSVNLDFFRESDTRTHYTVEVSGERVEDAAWYYPEPKDAAKNIKGHVASYGNKARLEG